MKTINQVCTQAVGEKLTCIGQVNVFLTLSICRWNVNAR